MRTLFLSVAVLSLTACIHVKNQLFNPADVKLLNPKDADRQPKSVVKVFTDHDVRDPNCSPSQENACLAFLEFDDLGERWDPKQLDGALALIQRAKTDVRPALVVTFTHGWKNNADDEPGQVNGNVFGFEGVLDYLRSKYGIPVVGIYIGWRGGLVTNYWPVLQQFSYFNRESAAIRIPGASLTSALTQIMETTHGVTPGQGPVPPVLVMVGHSFGGLVMERALTQAMTDYVLRGGKRSDGPWADLVVFVNSAAAASEAKQMLNLLKERSSKYQVTEAAKRREADKNSELGRTRERPLFLSISSLGDIATRFGLVIGHGPTALDRQLNGSWRTYTHPEPPSVPSQQSFFLSTTAHMQALQSHLIVEDNPEARKQCGPLFSQTPVTVTVGAAVGNRPAPTKKYVICVKPKSWNDTPYWAMEMPTTIVPDHSGIFNLNFISLLTKFLPSPDEMLDSSSRAVFTSQ
jgi:hypothetical protein